VIELRKIRWTGHVARMGRDEMHTAFWWGNLRERDQFQRPRHRWEVIFRVLFRK